MLFFKQEVIRLLSEDKLLAMDALPRDVLAKLVDDIYKAVGVRVTLVDRYGGRIALSAPDGFSICQASQSIPDFDKHCAACQAVVEKKAREIEGVYIYRCWRGLLSAFAPIKVDDTYLGRLEISIFVSTPESMAQAEQINPMPEYRITEEEAKQYPFLYEDRVKDTMNIIRIAASYITELYRRQIAEQLQAQAEFQALQSQIRPHFLFNALNSISQLALLEGAEQAPEAIYSLAGILRRSMKQSGQLVPLREELQLVADYVRIKQLTGRVQVRYTEELEPGLERMALPLLTVQPLVENAITHGLEEQNRDGSVCITAYRRGRDIVLSVTDDGAGFVPDKASRKNRGEVSGIGLDNVLSRLETFFGRSFGYQVISAPGEGTTISLCIPAEKAGV